MGLGLRYFAFKDWGILYVISILVRLIQEYSGIPYKCPYYSFEVDDCGPSVVNGTNITDNDYTNLINATLTNLGGYPTFGFIEEYIDPDSPLNIITHGQDPENY